MIPVALKLSNFTSYGKDVPELDFTKFHLAVISGSNGVGKSSILDAITWCVWGWSRAGDGSDQLVRLGANEMFVEFSFALDGHTYTVKRSRMLSRGGTTSLELWSANSTHNLTEGTIKATQQKIIDLLHLTFETFTNSSFLRQGHADEFTTKGPSERKRILSDILGLSHYDILEQKARDLSKDIQTKLQLLQYQLLEIETELSQKDDSHNKLKVAEETILKVEKTLTQTEDDLKALRQKKEGLAIAAEQKLKLEQSLSEFKLELEEITTQGKRRSERIKSLEEDTKNLPEIEKQLLQLREFQKKRDEINEQSQKRLQIENKISQISKELALKEQNKKRYEEELSKIESQLVNLEKEGAKCPTCGQEIGKEHKAQVKKDLLENKAKLNQELKSINTAKEEVEEKRYQDLLKSLPIADETNILSKLKDLETLQSEKEQKLKDQAELETEKKTVLELRVFYKNKLDSLQKIEKEIIKLPKTQEQLEQISQEITQKEENLNSLRNEEKEARNIYGQAKELITRSEQLENLQKTKLKEKANLENEKFIFEELGLAFGKKGIQAMIIETAIPEIKEEANALLNALSEGRMKVRFETLRETKTKMEDGEKGIIETLDIIISDEIGERPYEMYSGGEAFRVNFAIRLALSKLLTRRAGAKLQFLVIDEGFGTQDTTGRTRIVEVLDTIKNDFEKIIVITHLDELKEEFPVRVEVTKEADGSSFEVVGV